LLHTSAVSGTLTDMNEIETLRAAGELILGLLAIWILVATYFHREHRIGRS
jgi:hypothetical protein